MNLLFDNREHSLIDSCRKYIAINNINDIQIVIQTLDLADVIIKPIGNNNDDEKEVLYIERKTIADLLASIKDGRYEEQSYRLKNASEMPTHHIMYIIEGFLSSVSPSDKKMVLSALTSLNVFKGFSIMRTANVHETGELLVAMTTKIWREIQKGRVPFYFEKDMPTKTLNDVGNENDEDSIGRHNKMNENIMSYSNLVKKVKKENLTPSNMAEIVLCQIPGISSKTATAIMEKNRGSLMNLLKCIERDPDYLHDILLENGRKINKSCSAKIIEYLLF